MHPVSPSPDARARLSYRRDMRGDMNDDEATTSFSRRLHEHSWDTWQAMVQHPFVEQLFDGSLDGRAFRHYLVQGYQRFDHAVQVLGEAVATAPSSSTRLQLARRMGLLASDKNAYYERTFNALGVDLDERLHPALAHATVDMGQVMYEAMNTHAWPQILTVLTAREWILEELADPGYASTPPPQDRPDLAEWIELHRTTRSTTWVTFLRQQLDAAEPDDPAARTQCEELFAGVVAAALGCLDDAMAVREGATDPLQDPPHHPEDDYADLA